MTNNEFKERVERAWDEAWNKGEVARLDEIHALSFRRVDALRTVIHSHDDLKRIILKARSAFSDLTTAIDLFVVEGDTAAILWHGSGTHTGSFLGVPPTDRLVSFFGSVFMITDGDGKVIEEIVTWNPRELLLAAGIHSIGSAKEDGVLDD